MQKNTQFAAIKWIKGELQLSLKQARTLLEGIQVNFNNDSLEKFETIVHTLSNNLEIANDEVGSIKSDMSRIKAEISWLKRISGYLATILTGIFISVIGAILLNVFNS